jgi:hypothetical protein
LDPFSPKHLSNRHPINRNTTAFLEINLTALRNQTKLQITTTETFQISEPADRPPETQSDLPFVTRRSGNDHPPRGEKP